MEIKNSCPYLQSCRGQLKEYSVVYSDSSVNSMSDPFIQVMKDISILLKQTYKAKYTVLLPGSGTYAMEAVARQLCVKKKCIILRNGYFGFRWTQIFDQCEISDDTIVLKATLSDDSNEPQVSPVSIDVIQNYIIKEKPDILIASHVETSTGFINIKQIMRQFYIFLGIILSYDYICQIASAIHSVGGIFILDGIAAGQIWVDMDKQNIDIYISAPQKTWSSPACVGIVMMNEKAKQMMNQSKSNSFSIDLQKWFQVMQKYEEGTFQYHTTLPTDALTVLVKNIKVIVNVIGLQESQQRSEELGSRIRMIMKQAGLKSVAKEDFEAPTVCVFYGKISNMFQQFAKKGLQVAMGIPFQLDENQPLNCFRIGLFGIHKLENIDETIQTFEQALFSITKE